LLEGHPFWKQIIGRNTENFRQKQQFAVRNPAQLRFPSFRPKAKADAPAVQLQLLGEHGLRPCFGLACCKVMFRSNQIVLAGFLATGKVGVRAIRILVLSEKNHYEIS
jgi:hypothetical protein